jgi:hypothetical protein
MDYVLDDDDRGAVAGLELEEAPERITVGRRAGGGAVTVGIIPRSRKALAPLQHASSQLRVALASSDLDDCIDPNTVYADKNSDGARDYTAELANLADGVDLVLKANTDAQLENDPLELAKSLFSATLDEEEARPLRNAVLGIQTWFEREDPAAPARNILWERTPDFLLFSEADRTLESAYTLSDELLANIPSALKNLAVMAQFDLAGLFRFVQTGDIARRDTAIAQANSRLDSMFVKAWKQSRLSVRFSMDGPLLRIAMWEDGDNITVFSERSAGLRMFVALIAFLKAHGTEAPPVLLIDEAENHLHIDAQADLVNMFVTQEQAVKVVYTTHSPACLPPDLGSCIRSIIPRSDNLQVSDVRNSFWQGAAGYSPLMLAMGAAAAAFTPARRVVLAEGATEMILLPTLLREATREDVLDYQVAPGLSEVPKDFYPKLDLEGAKVAYLLDSDEGGRKLKKGLINAGVPKHLIISLGAAGIENILDRETYREAVAALLRECNPGATVPELPALSAPSEGSWAKVLLEWMEVQRLKPPSKVAVANWLIENGKAQPSDEGAEILRSAHKALMQSLD